MRERGISETTEVGNEQMSDFVEITHLIPIREPGHIIGRYDRIMIGKMKM